MTENPVERREGWLFGPILIFGVSQVAAALGSVFLCIATPGDAPLVFGPQALGTALIAMGTFELVRQLKVSNVSAELRRPVRTGAIGATIFAFGWVFYVVASRHQGWAWIAGAALGALAAVAYAVALWAVLSRLSARASATA